MTVWEYTTDWCAGGEEYSLDERGLAGWELAAITRRSDGGRTFYYKRPLVGRLTEAQQEELREAVRDLVHAFPIGADELFPDMSPELMEWLFK